MSMITVRNLDDAVKRALQQRAARHGRSMEAEVRSILTEAATQRESPNLYQAIRAHFADGDWDPALIGTREAAPQRNVDFDE